MNMETLPLVSVIVPCYNHQKYVRDAVKSILNQTYKNIELIVLDDGSTDNSPAILSDLSNKYGFFYEHQINMGLNQTLNKGLSIAKGKYICPFASDDVMFLDRIEKQVNALESHPDMAVCAGNMIAINENNEVLIKQKIRPSRELDFDDIFLSHVAGPSAPTAMIRSSVIKEVGGYDPAIRIEDLYMWLKITYAGYKILVLNDLLSYYRQHSGNFHSNYRAMYENELSIIAHYSDHQNYSNVKKRLQLSRFVKVASRDKQFARELFKEIPFFYSPVKLCKGVIRMLFK